MPRLMVEGSTVTDDPNESGCTTPPRGVEVLFTDELFSVSLTAAAVKTPITSKNNAITGIIAFLIRSPTYCPYKSGTIYIFFDFNRRGAHLMEHHLFRCLKWEMLSMTSKNI
ncbi:hypothetical protein [Methanothermobacter sp. KEPCO 2]|uniref:hypothetical protein n=1 Tax=Methanothermobacter sp. KEPCO 2 TaxID=3240977 RepID=UPI0035171A27